MSTSDKVKWTLLDNDLSTQVGGDINAISSKLLLIMNEPGMGDVKIRLDDNIVNDLSNGRFLVCNYRGSVRGGFFVDNLKQVDADQNEGAGRLLSVTGRGLLAVFDTFHVLNDGTNNSIRLFENMTKAGILLQLIDEAQDHGALSNVVCDFTDTDDTDANAWLTEESYSIPVGKKLLEVIRDFCKAGDFNVDINIVSGDITLSAYLNPIGNDLTNEVYFRIGSNCKEVSKDLRGGKELVNEYLYKSKVGYGIVSDSTSIAANGINADFLNLEQAQSDESARTFAAAKLELSKDPKENKGVELHDDIAPNVFLDYVLGDTVSLDRFGTVTEDRILSLQLEFTAEDYAAVIIDFNYLFLEHELQMQQDLDYLLDQWNTAREANLLEVRQGVSLGGANGQVRAIHTYGDYIYVGGAFTQISNLTASRIARYQISTHTWLIMSTGLPAEVNCIIDISGTIYASTTAGIVYSWNGTSWTTIGTAAGTAVYIRCMATDGTNLFVGGDLTSINAVTINGKVAKYNGSVWTDQNPNPVTAIALSMAWFDGNLHVGFTAPGGASSALKRYAGAGTNLLNLSTVNIRAMKTIGSNLVFCADDGGSNCTIYSWDGVSSGPGIGSAIVLGAITDFTVSYNDFANYLTDIYFVGDFSIMGGVSGFNGIAKYSGGEWLKLGEGLSTAALDAGYAVEVVDSDVYVGGIFTTAFGITVRNLAGFVTDFESLLDHLANDPTNNYDLGGAIHSATAAAITDAGELPFWDAVTGLLRKITWANIKTTIWTALGPAIAALTGKTTPVDADTFVIGDSAASNASKSLTWANVKATLKIYFDTLYAVLIGVSATTVTTSNVTAVVNTIYNLTIAGLTANRNFILPNAGVSGKRITVNILDGDDTYYIVLIGDTGITINGEAAATEFHRIQTKGRSITFESTSATNWKTIAGANLEELQWGVYINVSPLTATNSVPYAKSIDRGFTIKKYSQSYTVLTTNSGSHYWQFKILAANAGGSVSIDDDVNSSAGSPDVWQFAETTALDTSFLDKTYFVIYLQCNKAVGTPGNLYVASPAISVLYS